MKGRMTRLHFLGVVLFMFCITVIILSYLRTTEIASTNGPTIKEQTLPKLTPEVLPKQCFFHSDLCQLWHVFRQKYGLNMSQDIFDSFPLEYLKSSYLEQGVDLHKLRKDSIKLKDEVVAYRFTEYGKEDVYNLMEKIRTQQSGCGENNDSGYEYNCSLLSHATDQALVRISCIESTKQGYRSGGGASIYGRVTSDTTKASCKTVDFQNGLYHIACPIYDNNLMVNITSIFSNFSAFDYNCFKYNEKQLAHFDWNKIESVFGNMSPSNQTKTLKIGQQVCNSSTSIHEHDKGFWIQLSGVNYWSTGTCYFPYNLTDSQIKCLREKDILNMGDSHMLYRWNDVVYGYPNISGKFQFAGLAGQIAAQLKDNMFNYQKLPVEHLQKEFVIILNAAHWDTHFLEAFTFITNMEDVYKVIKLMKKQPQRTKIYWVAATPVKNRPDRPTAMRTTPMIAALNTWVKNKLKHLEVQYIDAFNIALPLMDSVQEDGSHFPGAFGNRVNVSGIENVSGAITSVVLNMICPSGS